MATERNKTKAIRLSGRESKIILQYIAGCDCVVGKKVTAQN
jgi:hypothetical protein